MDGAVMGALGDIGPKMKSQFSVKPPGTLCSHSAKCGTKSKLQQRLPSLSMTNRAN
jgi:hypothetical protein